MRYMVKFRDGRTATITYDDCLNNLCFDDMGYLRGENFIINLNDVVYIVPLEEFVDKEV